MTMRTRTAQKHRPDPPGSAADAALLTYTLKYKAAVRADFEFHEALLAQFSMNRVTNYKT